MAKRGTAGYLLITLKGMAMGAADVVPGVSGGTIAFITGIYEELLTSISRIDASLFKKVKTEGISGTWKHLNGNFLIALFLGILISIASLAKLLTFLLEEYPIHLWSFFFGLIFASIFLVGRKVNKWSVGPIIGLIAGTAIAYLITIASPSAGSQSTAYIFMCGMIAITAMILPGISGSFILLLLGAYQTILNSVSDLVSAIKDGAWDIAGENGIRIGVFGAGCLIGLVAFSKVLKWMFSKAHDLTIAVLTGFLIGSLNKVWPWKEDVEVYVKHPGEPDEEVIPLVQNNVTPGEFAHINEVDSHLTWAIGLCLVGMILIAVLGYFSPENQKEKVS
ncbi:DUF368 domain-containing protein [Halocola ammonii]